MNIRATVSLLSLHFSVTINVMHLKQRRSDLSLLTNDNEACFTVVLTVSGSWTTVSDKHVDCYNKIKRKCISSNLVSSGTLLLSTQLSCSWTDSGVVGPSPVPGAGAWMGLRPPLSVFLFRLLADWWDKVWWLCGGGSGGRSVDWLWWLAAPGRRQEERGN